MKTLLLVCTANICRSPMAMAILREQIRCEGLADAWRVESAGTWALEGQPASSGAQQAMAKRGLDLGPHRSRIVTRDLLRAADLVLVMERGHKEALCVEFPEEASRIYLLSEMEPGAPTEDIGDPVGGTLEEYEATADELNRRLLRGFQTILRTGEREFTRKTFRRHLYPDESNNN